MNFLVCDHSQRTRLRAQALRREGYTYAEIQQEIGRISKSTMAYWLKDIQLSQGQHKRIQAKIIASAARGRPLARAAWAKKMQRWRRSIEARVRSFGGLPYTNPVIGKLVCGMMYVCEGGKYPSSRHLTFGNVDPHMIRTFLKL